MIQESRGRSRNLRREVAGEVDASGGTGQFPFSWVWFDRSPIKCVRTKADGAVTPFAREVDEVAHTGLHSVNARCCPSSVNFSPAYIAASHASRVTLDASRRSRTSSAFRSAGIWARWAGVNRILPAGDVRLAGQGANGRLPQCGYWVALEPKTSTGNPTVPG